MAGLAATDGAGGGVHSGRRQQLRGELAGGHPAKNAGTEANRPPSGFTRWR